MWLASSLEAGEGKLCVPARQSWASLRFSQHATWFRWGGGRVGRLSVNRFADWTRQEYLDALLPNRLQRREGEEPFGGPFMRVHQAKVPAGLLPSTVDWRGTPQDTVPKDQAMCGSCWVRPPASRLPPLSWKPMPLYVSVWLVAVTQGYGPGTVVCVVQ